MGIVKRFFYCVLEPSDAVEKSDAILLDLLYTVFFSAFLKVTIFILSVLIFGDIGFTFIVFFFLNDVGLVLNLLFGALSGSFQVGFLKIIG